MIYHGDLFDVLPTLDADSIDACVTDPPYGLQFMGKEWDRLWRNQTVADVAWQKQEGGLFGRRRNAPDYNASDSHQMQEWHTRWAAEVFRVLKPGAHLLAFGGTRTYHRMTCAIEDAGFEIRDCLQWLYGSGFPKSLNVGNGWGTALKPACEPIVLARKPLIGTVAANVERYGTGAINVDACRIGTDSIETSGDLTAFDRRRFDHGTRPQDYATQVAPTMHVGRWPANVLLDEAAAAMLDAQTGELTSGSGDKHGRQSSSFMSSNDWQRFKGTSIGGDTGGASRFYYVAKPSREERNEGVDRNGHPTVKPIEVMRWLVRLVTPPEGIVLDPFMGAGTTGMACRYELRRFIGIEREAEYVAIARARIEQSVPLFADI